MRIPGDGVELEVNVDGEPDGPPVLLVHGFPDSAYLWRHQIEALTDAGLRTIAPDMRGFGASDKPAAVEDYRLTHAVADLVAVLDALEIEQAKVVGHDWGAAVVWIFAALHPDRVERLVAMSVGHPAAQKRTIADREKAWYQLLFQFEGVAEELVQRDDWKLFREWLRGDGDLDRYIGDLSRPGALTAGLSWYRANLHPARQLEPRPQLPPVRAPTLGIWSSGDNYLNEQPMLDSADRVDATFRYERVEGASHWMQLDATDRVNALLLEFLTSEAP
jgi:pimeloyl-ACP methyl ester carboxylesterase